MRYSSRLAATLSGAAVVLLAAVVEAQHPIAEQRAFGAVDKAITAAAVAESADDRDMMMQAAEHVFAAVKDVRSLIAQRLQAQRDFLTARARVFDLVRNGACFNAWYFPRRFELIAIALDAMSPWADAVGVPHNLSESAARLQRSVSELSQVLDTWDEPEIDGFDFGQPCGTTPSDGPDTPEAAQLRQKFNATIQEMNQGPIGYFGPTEARLGEIDAAANRAALDVISQAARTTLRMAERVIADYPSTYADILAGATETVNTVEMAAAEPEVFQDVDQMAAVLDALVTGVENAITIVRSASRFQAPDPAASDVRRPEAVLLDNPVAWLEQVAAAANAVELAVAQVDAAQGATSGESLLRVRECLGSLQGLMDAIEKLRDLTSGSETEVGIQMWEHLSANLYADERRAVDGCRAIAVVDPPGNPRQDSD